MAIPEPYDEHGLWAAVKAINAKSWSWPETNEDVMYSLARGWHAGSLAFATVAVRPEEFARAWPDSAGEVFASHVNNIVRQTATVGLSCRQHGSHVAAFAAILATTKRNISAIVANASPHYGRLLAPYGRHMFAVQVAKQVTSEMNSGVKAVEFLDSGAASGYSFDNPHAEFGDILSFMTDEMVSNSRDRRVLNMARYNDGDKWDQRAALVGWGLLVRPGGEWDHKDRILDKTEGDNAWTPIPGTSGQIRYDAWSNIHYGYVGTEAGFTGTQLHSGANVADLATQAKVDPADQAAVQFGIDLHKKYGPYQLTPEILQQEIVANYGALSSAGVIKPV